MNPGRIPSPTAVEAEGDNFNSQPIGAGPFVMKNWTPARNGPCARNENYWGDGPYLDELRFVAIRGDQARLDSIASGEIEAGFLRSAGVVTSAVEGGFHGFNNILSVGEALVINNGVNSTDTPGYDVRVRQALALAIDPEALNAVVDNGAGLWTKRMFSEASKYAGSVDAVPYDPQAAQALLDEAKLDGYDGKIVLTCDSAPEHEREGLALQAQLNAAGFDVELNAVPAITDTIRIFLTEGSFEYACYGFSFQDEAPYVGPVQTLHSGTNRLGYVSDRVDPLLDDLRQANGTDETVAAIDALQELMNDEQPFVPLAATRELIVWDESVHGMDVSVYTMPLFNEAWIAN